jgi:hypothetical protein
MVRGIFVQRLSFSCNGAFFAQSRPGRIGPISLGMKQMGERSAGNPHAAFDVEGTGDVARHRPKLARQSSTLPVRGAPSNGCPYRNREIALLSRSGLALHPGQSSSPAARPRLELAANGGSLGVRTDARVVVQAAGNATLREPEPESVSQKKADSAARCCLLHGQPPPLDLLGAAS